MSIEVFFCALFIYFLLEDGYYLCTPPKNHEGLFTHINNVSVLCQFSISKIHDISLMSICTHLYCMKSVIFKMAKFSDELPQTAIIFHEKEETEHKVKKIK